MMQVTLQGPAIIKVEDLAAFLQMAGVPAVVQLADCMVVPTPENPVVMDAGAQVNTPKVRKPRESRNAQTPKSPDPVADPAPAATTTEPESAASQQPTGSTGSPPPDTSALADRFMAFVDADYDKALELLKEYGVARFSELPSELIDNFDSRLAEAGF